MTQEGGIEKVCNYERASEVKIFGVVLCGVVWCSVMWYGTVWYVMV